MAQINVSNLKFSYDNNSDNIFENVSFCIDTDWKLGFIGCNGKADAAACCRFCSPGKMIFF